ncbi:MAG: hypothetical protein HYV33_05675 [Candidatus Kerfeldbacteria bacterium]|nr:hypothetical protein [Candidatus Kerfeldbacteria bacterium]
MSLPDNFSAIIANLPRRSLLILAQAIQHRLLTDASLVSIKEKKQYVTQADYDIQQAILDYFQQSPLQKSYYVKAEEAFTNPVATVGTPTWQLLIDPLDGTTAFCEQQTTWGVMVGAGAVTGELLYSWNLVSTGEVYSTTTAKLNQLVPQSFAAKIQREQAITIDVYDYGASAGDRFGAQFTAMSGIERHQFKQTAYPAAVWAGWKLYQGALDGLVWLPSNQGKGVYPDYDLIFLGALAAQGWCIQLGKIKDTVAMVTIAATPGDAALLYEVGRNLVPAEIRPKLYATRDLIITKKI